MTCIITSCLGSLWPHCTYAGPHPAPRDPLKCRSDLINPPGTFHYTLNTSKGFSFWLVLHTGFLLLFLTLLTSAPASRPVHFPLPWTPSSLFHTLFLTTLSPRISHPLFREMGSDTIDSCPHSLPRPITVCPYSALFSSCSLTFFCHESQSFCIPGSVLSAFQILILWTS